MGMSVVLKNRTGEVLVRLPRPYVPLVSWTERAEYPILGYVDPYGNTIYNRGQMETLMEELVRIRQASLELSEDTRASIDGLLELSAKGVQKPHRYLWFIGD
jgi:hypothetical protein